VTEDLNSGLPKNKSRLWQGGGLEPGASGLQHVGNEVGKGNGTLAAKQLIRASLVSRHLGILWTTFNY